MSSKLFGFGRILALLVVSMSAAQPIVVAAFGWPAWLRVPAEIEAFKRVHVPGADAMQIVARYAETRSWCDVYVYPNPIADKSGMASLREESEILKRTLPEAYAGFELAGTFERRSSVTGGAVEGILVVGKARTSGPWRTTYAFIYAVDDFRLKFRVTSDLHSDKILELVDKMLVAMVDLTQTGSRNPIPPRPSSAAHP